MRQLMPKLSFIIRRRYLLSRRSYCLCADFQQPRSTEQHIGLLVKHDMSVVNHVQVVAEFSRSPAMWGLMRTERRSSSSRYSRIRSRTVSLATTSRPEVGSSRMISCARWLSARRIFSWLSFRWRNLSVFYRKAAESGGSAPRRYCGQNSGRNDS